MTSKGIAGLMNIPVMLNVEGRSCLVIGGGKIGLRKAIALKNAGAEVTVLSLSLCKNLPASITFRQEAYSRKHLLQLNPWLVVAATDSPKINQQIQEDANTARILVMRADEAEEGDLHSLPFYQEGDITLAISSGSPHFSQHLLEQFEAQITPEILNCAVLFKTVRTLCRQLIPSPAARAEFWEDVFTSPVLKLAQEGHSQEAKHLMLKLLRKWVNGNALIAENEERPSYELC